MPEYNAVTVVLVAVFLLPIVIGAVRPFTRGEIRYSLESFLDNVEFLAALLLSVYFTKQVFFEQSRDVYREIYEYIPQGIRSALQGQDILTYLLAVPVILLVLLLLLRLITNPFHKYVAVPISEGIYRITASMGSFGRALMGALWQVPRSAYLVFIVGLLLNFLSYYLPSPRLADWMHTSDTYQLLYAKAIHPVLNSNLAKKIPVLINDSFGKAVESVVPVEGDAASLSERLKRLTEGNIRVIEYFNGVTLDEAVKSSPEIDETARSVAGDGQDDRKKANLLYKWVTQNIQYDYDKAASISKDPKGISSGAVVAFTTRKGVCFDYSSLYIAMCRAVGVKVRLVTGLGYSGVSWGDHAWNQVYSSAENRWINVDTTFGTAANYFDKPDFQVDHKYDEVQGEW